MCHIHLSLSYLFSKILQNVKEMWNYTNKFVSNLTLDD